MLVDVEAPDRDSAVGGFVFRVVCIARDLFDLPADPARSTRLRTGTTHACRRARRAGARADLERYDMQALADLPRN
jgi:hypothetical protein